MKKVTILSIILMIMLALPTVANAGYQSKPGVSYTSVTADNHFENCRNMEVEGGVLGLKEELATDYSGTTQNGIDAHMILNTEWGTIALLTNSTYGIGREIAGTSSTKTSTGNSTGVYNLARGVEYTATTYSGTSSSYSTKLRSSKDCYFNSYSSATPKKGDALNCQGWLSTTMKETATTSKPVYIRGYYGLFGYSSDSGAYRGGYNGYDASSYKYYNSRAVVVCAAGL